MEVNPYQPPIEDAVPELGGDEQYLATRGSRFAAAFIDGIANLIVVVPMMWGLGMLENLARPDIGTQLINGALGFAVWFAINIAFLANGQTLGKKMMGLRMVDYTTGQSVPVARLLLMRYLPTSVVANIPTIGPFLTLVDILFIFGGEQRCVHDLIAGTKVIQA